MPVAAARRREWAVSDGSGSGPPDPTPSRHVHVHHEGHKQQPAANGHRYPASLEAVAVPAPSSRTSSVVATLGRLSVGWLPSRPRSTLGSAPRTRSLPSRSWLWQPLHHQVMVWDSLFSLGPRLASPASPGSEPEVTHIATDERQPRDAGQQLCADYDQDQEPRARDDEARDEPLEGEGQRSE